MRSSLDRVQILVLAIYIVLIGMYIATNWDLIFPSSKKDSVSCHYVKLGDSL